MSSIGVNITEDADMAECDGEKVVTMMDVLREQQDFEEDANAVLGASDDKNCTFVKGYIKRQALYACLTCCSEAKTDPTKRAGVCLACSLNCHENHELIELYTKRNFRCDCGNPKFSSHPCQYTPVKNDLNEENSYNQNFSGLYCTCHRPYPDPESAFEDEMIQCIICEDWLHAAHLEANLPSTEQYAEMVCKACMEKNEFLHDYSDIAVNNETSDVDVSSVNDTDTPAADKSSEIGTSKVNGALDSTGVSDDKIKTDIEMDGPDNNKVDSTSEPEGDKTKDSEESVPDTTDENKTDIPMPDTQKPNEDGSEVSTENDKPEETNVNETINDLNINNETLDDVIDKKETAPGLEETPTTVENVVQKNDDSIIDSIEKLESELGNVEPKDKVDDSEQTSTPRNNDNKTELKVENSINAESEKVESDLSKVDNTVDPKTSDIEMNEANESKADTENAVQNRTIDNGVTDTAIKNGANGNGKTEECTKDIKRKLSTEQSDEVSIKKPKLEKSGCTRPKGVKRIFKGATFWPSNFRQQLCTCNECISMYKDLSVLFLTDSEDTVTAYEALGKERIDGSASSQYERGLEALSSLDRIQQINALTEYNKMRDKLLDFLKSFKDRKEVVKEEDIKAFFAGMKPKREPDGVYFCR